MFNICVCELEDLPVRCEMECPNYKCHLFYYVGGLISFCFLLCFSSDLD